MADPAGPSEIRPPPTPRWVKVLGVGLALAIVAVVIVMVVAGGSHGPWQHGG